MHDPEAVRDSAPAPAGTSPAFAAARVVMKLLSPPGLALAAVPAAPRERPAPRPDSSRATLLPAWLFTLLALGLGFAIYRYVGHFEFLNFDDDRFIAENPWLYRGFSWESIQWAFTANLTHFSPFAEYWSPLTLLTRLADGSAFGMNPGAFHVTSAAIHVGNALLLAAALWKLTGKWERSACVALLFLVHPLNVEPVCWLSARKDLVSGTFFFATLLAYGHYACRPNGARYLILLAAFCCALMAKPMGVSLPLVLLVLDVWPLARWSKGDLKSALRLAMEKAPHMIVAGVAAMLAVLSQRDVGALRSAAGYSLSVRIGNAIVAYALYVRRTFWPSDLAAYYPHPGSGLPLWQVAVSAALLLCITLAAFRLRRRFPYLLAGWLWFGIVLGPVIGIVQIGQQALADRYAYPSLIGLLIAIVWGAADAMRGRGRTRAACAAVAIGALSLAAMRQALTWRDSITVFTRAASVTRNNTVAYLSLGAAYHAAGDLQKAHDFFFQALCTTPTAPILWLDLGNTEAELGREDAAIQDFWLALQTDKTNPAYQKTLMAMSRALLRRQANAQAVAYLKSAIDVDPYSAEPYRLLGDLCTKQGNWRAAASVWTEWLKRYPADARGLSDLRQAQMHLHAK